MIRERLLFLLSLLLLSLPAIAQVEVKGTIIEESNKQPIEQATIRLLSVKDSSLISGVVSSKNGAFSLKNVKNGTYLLSVTFIGLDPIYQPLQITGKTNPIHVGKLEMTDGGIMLGEAVVTAKAVEVSVRNDTVEYNADSYKVTEGSMLEDLLKKMPGVEIDSEGKVTVNGKEIKKIMVDGKEFFSNDPKVASKNVPAKMIDKVQVLDKKSDMTTMTGFDDGEEEAVINLTVKPGMKQGWFGNAFAGYGSKDRYEGNFMVNRFINNDQFTVTGGLNNTNNMGFTDMGSSAFSGMGGGRRGGTSFGGGNGITESGNIGANFSKEINPKLIWGGNARYSRSDNIAEDTTSTYNYFKNDSTTQESGRSRSNVINDNIGANFRLEWKPDTLTQIIFRPDFSYSKTSSVSDEDSYSLAGIKDTPLDTVNRSTARNTSEGEAYNISARLEFSRKLNNQGRVFSGSLSGGLNDSYTNGMDRSHTDYLLWKDSIQDIDQYVRYDNNGYNYRAYLSWVEPLGRNNFLQATYRFSQNRQESLKNAYNKDGAKHYTELDTVYSKNTRNNATEQRISLAFKAVREKYNYTVGVNVDPSYSRTETFIGDTVLYSKSRNVTNFSPTAQLNYRFDKRTNLRIDYDGRTSQPSMSQLQPVRDVSDPLNTIIGNPDLKPSYTNNLRIHFQKFQSERQSTFMVMADGNYKINGIASKTKTDLTTNKKVTTYENVNGDFGGNVRINYNTPLKNKKFSINTMTWGMYSNSNGFVNGQKNTNKALTLMERAGINYRSNLFDFGLNGNIRYNQTKKSIQNQNDLQTFNYGGGASTTINLPYNFQIESDINYSTNSGYAKGYDQEELLWNASISKSLFKNNAGTIRIKMYDILKERSNISFSDTGNSTRYSEYNTLSSYFMAYFIYKFSIFSGGASESDMRGRGPDRYRGPGGPPRFRD